MQKGFLIAGIVLLGFLFNSGMAQDVNILERFTRYTTDDGLSNQIVRSITQDKQGNIWIGTEDGLNKFDGYEFKTYRFDPTDPNSLPDNFIADVVPSSDGGVYASTVKGGFAKYDPINKNFIVYSAIYGQPGALQWNTIGALYEDRGGNLWVGALGGGLYFKPAGADTFKLYINDPNNQESIAGNGILDIVEDSKDNVWIHTDQGLTKLDPVNGSLINISLDRETNTVLDRYVNNMIIDKDDVLWIAFNTELIKFDTRTNNIEYIVPTNLPDGFGFAGSVCEHDDSHLWIGEHDLIHLFDKRTYTVKTIDHDPENPNSLPLGPNGDIFIDNTGVLWCSGLAKLNLITKKFGQISTDEESRITIHDNFISSLYIDNAKTYWIATPSGIDVVNSAQWRQDFFPVIPDDTTYFLNNPPSAFTTDNQGNVWVGTSGGGIVILPNGEISDFYRIPVKPGVSNALQDPTILSLYQDSKGMMWIGTNMGVNAMDINTGEVRYFPTGGDNAPTAFGAQPGCITEDDSGNIWFGTWGGLTKIDINSSDSYIMDAQYEMNIFYRIAGDMNSLGDERVSSILFDNMNYPGRIFVGTDGGGLNVLYKNENGEYDSTQYITTKDGLSNNNIYGLVPDDDGNLWVSTRNGLNSIDFNSGEIKTYDRKDGLLGNEFHMASSGKDGSLLLFGGVNGINVFNPKELKPNNIPPTLIFTELSINNEILHAGDKIHKRVILKTDINQTEKITLTHKDKVITIAFAALHYAYPSENTYECKMEGFDDEWKSVDSKIRKVTYSNLRPGTYKFMVRAKNYDGIGTAEPRVITIKVKTPWWKSIAFYVIILFIVVLGVLYIIRQREEKSRQDKALLEQKIKQGEAVIADKMKQVELQQQEIKDRDEQEKEIRFITDGIARFSDISNASSNDLDKLSQSVVSELVSYVDGCMGALFLLNESNPEEKYLELKGSFASKLDANNHNKFNLGEGYVGACFNDAETIVLKDVPKDYTQLSSGLGNSTPNYFYFIPLKQNELIEGVIELGSFKQLDDYKIQFIEKVAENITSVITIRKSKIEADEMLERSNQQAEELQVQEEEMRQNLEELMATQEELERHAASNEAMVEKIKMQATLLNAMLNQLPDLIYFKDLESKFISMSKSMLPLFPYDNVEDMVGKSDFDFHKESLAQQFYNDEMEIIKSGKGIVDNIIKEDLKDGNYRWVSTTKLPLINEDGKCIGTFGITRDITEQKELEIKAKERNDELMMAEEELRQNLEEMQATQEELERNKEEQEKTNALMFAMMNNMNELIYFKDKESKFIMVSESMAQRFNVKSGAELIGKSDFDFYAEEHALPAYNDEQEIINSGKPILNKIEKETHNDGTVTYVKTSKFPLLNSENEIIGTFGISVDITNTVLMEQEIKQKNEACKKQEQELLAKIERIQKEKQLIENKLKRNK